jgi:uncharacterized protein
MFNEREVEGTTHLIVGEWCYGYMRGVALDAYAWSATDADIESLLRPIQLWGTEEGWRRIEAMSDADKARERNAIPQSVRALYEYWLDRRALQSAPIQRASPKVGRTDPCPCGSGKKVQALLLAVIPGAMPAWRPAVIL